jgi:peptidoglycan/xylan/chitin deacetylase (PgdA/CDA1 family)
MTAETASTRGPWPRPPLVDASIAVHAAAAGVAVIHPPAAGWAVAAVLANHALLTGAGLWPRSRLLGPNWTTLPRSAADAGQVALTIDDGPDPQVTPRVLDVLEAAGAHASFFCIGERARRHPAIVREIVARGHDVQNHTEHHLHHFSLLGSRGLEREIATAQATLADLTGRRPHCLRAPAGLRNPLLDPVLHRLGLHLVSWTRRGFDTREPEVRRVRQRLLRGLAAGDILLLHDGHARRGVDDRPHVLAVLPDLLAACAARGLVTVTLAQALRPRGADA